MRLTTKPVTTPDTAYRKKKLEPTRPNWLGVNSRSFMIGAAASPITALSAKLISINRNRRRTITQAYFDGLCVLMCFLPFLDRRLLSAAKSAICMRGALPTHQAGIRTGRDLYPCTKLE